MKKSHDLSCTRANISTCLLHQGHASALLLHCSSLIQETGYRYSAFYCKFIPLNTTLDTSVFYEDIVVCFAWLNAALFLQGTFFTGLQLSHCVVYMTLFLSWNIPAQPSPYSLCTRTHCNACIFKKHLGIKLRQKIFLFILQTRVRVSFSQSCLPDMNSSREGNLRMAYKTSSEVWLSTAEATLIFIISFKFCMKRNTSMSQSSCTAMLPYLFDHFVSLL